MGNALNGGAGSDRVRIESTLEWYFNFADVDLGLRSNHAATVAHLINPKGRAAPSADAAEETMFRAVDAVRRFRAVSEAVKRMSPRDQRDLQKSFTLRRSPEELKARPATQRWFAASSPAVRAFLEVHGLAEWSLGRGEALLAQAERAVGAKRDAALEAVRSDAWTFAERALDELVARFGDAERAVAEEMAAGRAAERAKASPRSRAGDAKRGWLS